MTGYNEDILHIAYNSLTQPTTPTRHPKAGKCSSFFSTNARTVTYLGINFIIIGIIIHNTDNSPVSKQTQNAVYPQQMFSARRRVIESTFICSGNECRKKKNGIPKETNEDVQTRKMFLEGVIWLSEMLNINSACTTMDFSGF